MRAAGVAPRHFLMGKSGFFVVRARDAARGMARLTAVVSATALILAAGLVAWRVVTALANHPRSETPAGSIRIVSLAPSITEVVFSLGLGGQLVGVTDACDFPAEARSITTVGPFVQPNIERILTLRPDIAIAVSGRLSVEQARPRTDESCLDAADPLLQPTRRVAYEQDGAPIGCP